MPVIEPAVSERNFTPSSTAPLSFSDGVTGVWPAVQMVHGQVAARAGAAGRVTSRPRPSTTVIRKATTRRCRADRENTTTVERIEAPFETRYGVVKATSTQ